MNPSNPEGSVQERSRAEERFQLLADCATDYAFILFDRENRVTDWSAGAERILGYTEAEILGRSGALFFTPEDRRNGAVEQELETARRDGRSEDERWHLRKDGTRFWASGVMTALRDGELHGFAKVLRDLTVRKQHEQERESLLAQLEAEHSRLAEILESISDAFYAVDAEYRFTYVNRKAEEWWKRKREELIGRHYWTEFPQAVNSEFYLMHQKVMSERQPVHYETLSPIIGRWIDVTIYPETQGGLSCYFRDITDRKQAEMALRESEQRMQLAQLVAGIATWDWNIVENRCQWSKSMGPLFGLPIGASPGNIDAFLAQVYSEDRAAVECSLGNTLKQDAPYEVRFRTVWPDGSVHWLLAVGRVFRNEQGDPARLLGVATDITDRKQTEDRAEQERQQIQEEIQRTRQILERAKEEVRELSLRLATVQDEERRRIARDLHDTAAQRLALLEMELNSLVQQPPTVPEIPRERVQRLRQRTKELSNELRQLAHQLHPSILDHFGLRVALRQLIEDFNAHWPQPIEFFVFDLPDNLPLPVATALYRIAQEALRNISKHAPGALVLVTLKGSKNHLLLRIEDDGPGFVYRKGTRPGGLGLISIEERVHLLGGKLVLRTRPRKGTRIYVRIPL